MEDMGEIRKGQLKGVFALWQVEGNLSLPLTVVKALTLNGWDRLLGVEFRGIHVDEEMVVSGIGQVGAGGADTHALEAKANRDGSLDGLSIFDSLDVDPGSFWGRSFERIGRFGRFVLAEGGNERAHEGDDSN